MKSFGSPGNQRINFAVSKAQETETFSLRFPSMFLLFIVFFSALTSTSFAFPNEELRQLWDISTKEVKTETIKSYRRGNIKVEEVYYLSRSYKRQPVRIFGYYCYPVNHAGKLPAILLSHGGGGCASLARADAWARRGYAVLAIDLPGKGEKRACSRSTGPDMDVVNLVKTEPDPSYNYLVHAVAAARNGITFLTQRKEVDADRIGMIGLSWGGVLTILTNGQDTRLRAAVNVFGAGYIPEGCTWEKWFKAMPAADKEIWDKYIDPKNFLASQHAPILFITGTNDHCYYLPTFQKSYEQVTAPKNYYLIANCRHRFLSEAADPALAWLDKKLKNGGSFPAVGLIGPFQTNEKKVIISARIRSDNPVASVRLYYTFGGPQQWTEKQWYEVMPFKENGTYYFGIPTKRLTPEILYYVSAKDSRGGASSSLIRSLFAVKFKDANTFATSGPITKIYQHAAPYTFLNGLVSSTIRFIQLETGRGYQAYDVDSAPPTP
ncbi:MAG TPA: alpha/beta fold hydrolase [Candidatus Sulfotelmatobacter sp.]|nr:alpha/beta fold hydrolase [Candidatus Sulfotelmatobacter sp.]